MVGVGIPINPGGSDAMRNVIIRGCSALQRGYTGSIRDRSFAMETILGESCCY
jgi:hypothetical protein